MKNNLVVKKASIAKAFGELLKQQAEKDPHFYLFSPDETTSNKLDKIYEATARAWGDNLPQKDWDLPEKTDGRIVELLSENVLFSVMIGHLLSNEPAMMTSYEAFFTIILAQIIQHLKFLEQSEEVSWRPKYPSVNLLSTSTCWRQDHNGFSHQSPLLISALLNRPGTHVNCLFPIDASVAEPCFSYLLGSRNQVNLVTFNKTDEPVWLSKQQAITNFSQGYSILESVSNPDQDGKYDVYFVAAGDIASRESIFAIRLLRQSFPDLHLCFVNFSALTYGKIGTSAHPLDQQTFDRIFGQTAPIIANFHGYADTLVNILSNYTDKKRIKGHGFKEQGSTVTPFEMLILNQVSRFDLAVDVADLLNVAQKASEYREEINKYHNYALENGIDDPVLGIDN